MPRKKGKKVCNLFCSVQNWKICCLRSTRHCPLGYSVLFFFPPLCRMQRCRRWGETKLCRKSSWTVMVLFDTHHTDYCFLCHTVIPPTWGQGQVLSAQWDWVKCCLHNGTGTSVVCTMGQEQVLSTQWDWGKCCLHNGTGASAVCTMGHGQVLSAQWDWVKCCLHSGTGTSAACIVGQGQMLPA